MSRLRFGDSWPKTVHIRGTPRDPDPRKKHPRTGETERERQRERVYWKRYSTTGDPGPRPRVRPRVPSPPTPLHFPPSLCMSTNAHGPTKIHPLSPCPAPAPAMVDPRQILASNRGELVACRGGGGGRLACRGGNCP
jgi:hypothetical protein